MNRATSVTTTPVSVRFRADPRDRHPSSSASPPLNPVGVDTLDVKIKKIEDLTEKLQSKRSSLNESISRFLHSTTSDVRTLEDTLLKLRTVLEPYKWRLERPKRYLMQIVFTAAPPTANSLVNDAVLLFNQINTLCAETIKTAINLKALVDQFLKEAELRNTTESNRDELSDGTAYLVAVTSDLSRAELERRITEFRCRYVNENNARLIEQEANKALLESRKLFCNLVRACAMCLV